MTDRDPPSAADRADTSPRLATPSAARRAGRVAFDLGAGGEAAGAAEIAIAEPSPPRLARDPVCGMSVDMDKAKWRGEHAGETYYFCAERCRDRFLADPQRFLEPRAPEPVVAGAIYTCPMDPEVRQEGPGSCPVCGMALEPEILTADAGPNPELLDMTRRLVIGAALSAPLVAFEMGQHLGLWAHGSLAAYANWIGLALATPVVFYAGLPFLERGARSLLTRNLNMFTLVALGTLAAWGYSVIATLLPTAFPPEMVSHDGRVPVYFEAAAVITVLVLLGQVLELRAREATGGAIRALLDLAPKMARRIGRDGTEHEIAVERLVVGDRLRVRPGERVPVDGVIEEGQSAIDQSMITGEALPVERGPSQRVIGGTLACTGSFVMRASRVGRETMLAEIVALVAEAQRSRAPAQRLADRVSAWFVPTVVAVAALAFLGWMLLGPEPRLAYALSAAVTVLIIACPCALGLATPMAIMVGIGRGAGMGILVRSAEALERLETADTIVFDKTGTLTEGRPTVTHVRLLGELQEARVLQLAASLEQGSEHPIAAAIVAAASARGITLSRASSFVADAGAGALGVVEGHALVIGTEALMAGKGLSHPSLGAEIKAFEQTGESAVVVAVDGKVEAIVTLSDPIKASTADAVAALKAKGVRLIMATGDGAGAAQAVASALGIEEVFSRVLPAEKALLVSRLTREGRRVVMAGDGINDAPALAAAAVGVAMGTGTDVAIKSAGIVLVKGDLAGLVSARRLSEAVARTIRQNLAFAFGYNAIGVPIAAGLLYPTFGLLLSPMIGAAAMSLSSVSVIANALRLKRVPL